MFILTKSVGKMTIRLIFCGFLFGRVKSYCIYIYIPGTLLTSIFEGQPLITRPFRIKTKVIWVLGTYIIYIYIICISIYWVETGRLENQIYSGAKLQGKWKIFGHWGGPFVGNCVFLDFAALETYPSLEKGG